MKKNEKKDQGAELARELNRVRQLSLAASRQNDYRTVARLTCEAAVLNRALRHQEGFKDQSLSVLDALADVSDPGVFVFPQLEETAKEAA